MGMVFLKQRREPGTSQADENASVALAGETGLMLQRCLKEGVSVCLSLQGADSSSWSLVFSLVSHNDNSACPGEAQPMSHIGRLANPPWGGS